MGHECPFCGVIVTGALTLERVVLAAFEAHLDEHMSNGDHLLVVELRAAS